VCVYGTTGWPARRTVNTHHAAKHRPSTRQTSVNHYEFQSSTALILPDDGSRTIRNMSE